LISPSIASLCLFKKIIHGLWTPNEAFFHQNPNFCGIWGIFGRFGTASPLSMFSMNQPWLIIISTKKLNLYIQIPNIYLGLGFEFGSQEIVCP